MKTRAATYARTFWWTLAIVSGTQFLSVAAQSERVIPTPTSQAASTNVPEAKSKFVVDPNAPKYKLIFPTGYDLKFYTHKKKEYVHPTETEASGLNRFVEQLNEAGAQGYRLVSAVGDSMAIVKLGNVQYEYAGFDNLISYSPGVVGFAAKYEQLAKQGFRLASQPLIRFQCFSSGCDGEDCDSNEFFILERVMGVEKELKHKLVSKHLYSRPDIGMTAVFNELLASGFHPTNVISMYEVVFEQTTENNERFADKTDLQVVMASLSYWGRDDLPNKIKLLAKQGYRLALINYQLAVMYRPRGSARPVSYFWLKMGKRNWMERRKERDFRNKLSKLQENGAIYRMAYTNNQGDVNTLIFEEGAVARGKRREYSVLKFELRAVENVAEKKMQVELTPSSKEAWMEFNRLVNDEFEARELFVTDEACVLLERNSAQ